MLANLIPAQGTYPQAGLLADTSGNLYATAADGGASRACPGGYGTVVKVTP